MRKGFDGLAMLVQEKLKRDPFGGQMFVFRGRRGYLLKALWWDGQGLCLYAKRLEKGRFVWSSSADGSVVLTLAQLGMLLEGIDGRTPESKRRAYPALCGRHAHRGVLESAMAATHSACDSISQTSPPTPPRCTKSSPRRLPRERHAKRSSQPLRYEVAVEAPTPQPLRRQKNRE
jgi:transposase